jgi:small subunit ribosomal protein S4
VREGSRQLTSVLAAMEQASRGQSPTWLAADKDTFSGRMLERPQREQIPIAAQEQLVVELYSK